MGPVVSISDAGKRYVKYDDVPMLLTRAIRFRAQHRRTHIWALRHVDLDVDAGESLGVIGRNGSGKSTMFRMLAGVTSPTEGVVRVRGRVAPLIAVGVGFHPELSGRENVYVNGTILGLQPREIDRRMDSIVDFADIGEFLDTPVKFYSSGMFVRLGFSVAVAADPEVLLVDEVLAVGDLAFQQKCFERMEEIRQTGATVLVVSHNMNAIRRLCTRTLVLDKGVQLFVGDTNEAISLYHEQMDKPLESEPGSGSPGFRDFAMMDGDGRPTAHVRSGDEITFKIEARFSEATDHPVAVLQILSQGVLLYSEFFVGRLPDRVEAGQVIQCDVRMRAALASGSYSAQASLRTGLEKDAVSAGSGLLNFFVSGREGVRGSADLGATFDWRVAPDSSEPS